MSARSPFSPEVCMWIASEVSGLAQESSCTDREVKEGIIHAWRAYLGGGSPEQAVQRGIVHAEGLMEARTRPLSSGIYG